MPQPRTVYDAFQNGLRINPNADCLGDRSYHADTGSFSEYDWQSYATIHTRLTCFGSGLVHLHHQLFPEMDESARQQWIVGIWGPNRREWTIAGAGCCAYNLISVGLFDALEIEAIIFIINHSEMPVVVTSANHIIELLKNADRMPGLKAIISMGCQQEFGAKNVPGYDYVSSDVVFRTWADEKGIRILGFSEVELLGELHGRKHVPPRPDDLYTIAYTSGTTGVPRGAMVSHSNYIAFMAANEDTIPVNKDDTVFNFSPLGHVFGRMMEAMAFSTGARAGYSSGSPLRLLEDMKALRPTLLPMVPRLLNRIYARLRMATVEAPGIVGALSRKAFSDKLNNLKSGKGLCHPLWDRLLFNNVRQVFGGSVRYIMTDVPELNYLTTDRPFPRGEICIRGPTVIRGYLKDERMTREAIDLAQGEYVAAEKIENQLLAKVSLIQQIFVHGDSHESYLIAIVVPEPEIFLPFVKQILDTDISSSNSLAFREACSHPQMRSAMLQVIIDAGKALQLKGFEIPRAIFIEPTPFSIENGLITPTFKIKRHPIVQLYQKQLTTMYDELKQLQSKL
ncbi:hypothetical protein DFQ27_007319 [Actinomortierella ambigua]|uniref:AMP-dependent synthetase/ligase domain-containing protein n=1 Tax=Actinomortierella ambigua TaxID=1343610 RepID=A0A9P6QIV2_9FUNG|nr:hypothetical protein DFQ27_007319 [Actinomortierella ambigua]